MEHFLVASLLFLAVSSITIMLSKSLGLGSILGLLIAGVIIGPYTPGPYITQDVESLRHFAELGVVLLLFIIGLEMQPKKLWSMKIQVFGIGGLQVILTGIVLGFYINQYITPLSLALVLGFTLSLSSTAFVMQLLQEKGEIASLHGRSSFAILLFQDLAIVPLLAILPLLATSQTISFDEAFFMKALFVFVSISIVVIYGRNIAPKAFERVAKQGNTDAFLFISILSVVLASYLMAKSGLSMGLGAFMMGMLFSTSRYRFQIQASIEPFRGILMSIFFVAVGMSINIQSLLKDPLGIVFNIISIFAIKTILVFIIALLFKHPIAPAIRMSFLLNQCGEFGFVLFGSAKALALIDDSTFALGMGVISISMLFTPFMYNLGLKIANNLTKSSTMNFINTSEHEKTNVVIAGFGDTGKIIASMLKHVRINYIAVDNNIEIVKEARKQGEEVFYGNIADNKLLDALRIEQSQIVVISINHGISAIRAITHISEQYPQIYLIARSLNIKTMNKMFRSGANKVIAERAESSLIIGSEVLLNMGIPEEDISSLLESFRKNEYELIKQIDEQS